MSRPTLYFLRHGETDWNVEGRLQGQRDIPLNDLGRVQAEEAGRKLAALLPRPEDLRWQVSPLSRTRETAELAREAIGLHGVGYHLDERLKELTFGAWEGLTWPELRQRDPRGAAARTLDKWHYAPPGGGESYAMLLARLEPWLAEQDRDAIIVSHGGVARALLVLLGGDTPAAAAERDIHQGKVLVFEAGTVRWV